MPSYTDPYEQWKAAGRPGGSFQAWQGGQAAAPAAPAASAPVAGAWTPDQIRQHFMSQASSTSGTGYNDTFNAIDNNTMQAWIDKGLWDQNRKVWLNERDPSQIIDYSRQTDYKPTDCPEGMTPNGANGPCVPNTDFDPITGAYRPGAGRAAPAASGAAPAAEVSNGGWTGAANPLQGLMATQAATPAAKPNGNPFMQQSGYQTSGLAAALTPYQAQPQQQQTDGLTGTVMPWQKRKQQQSTGWFTGMR